MRGGVGAGGAVRNRAQPLDPAEQRATDARINARVRADRPWRGRAVKGFEFEAGICGFPSEADSVCGVASAGFAHRVLRARIGGVGGALVAGVLQRFLGCLM